MDWGGGCRTSAGAGVLASGWWSWRSCLGARVDLVLGMIAIPSQLGRLGTGISATGEYDVWHDIALMQVLYVRIPGCTFSVCGFATRASRGRHNDKQQSIGRRPLDHELGTNGERARPSVSIFCNDQELGFVGDAKVKECWQTLSCYSC